MRRRKFLALLGGAVIVLLGIGGIGFRTLEARARGLSFQAGILRLVLRWFVKVRSGPGPDVVTLRQRIELIKWIIPGPVGDTRTIQLSADGVPAFRVTRPESRDGHHAMSKPRPYLLLVPLAHNEERKIAPVATSLELGRAACVVRVSCIA